jgi:predicted ribosome quality control (RQC) complex YloA/Tae2 family protein
MTDPAQSHDGSTVVALAIQISTLRQDLQSAITRIDALTEQQRQQAQAQQAVSELRRRVEAVLAYLDVTENASPAA